MQDPSFSVVVTFSDPAGAYDEPYTCGFDMDSDGTVDTTITGVTGTSCSTTLDYAEPGVYTVTVSVTDKDGGVGTGVATSYIVIYDPDGGFVTGGGWIDSEAGWCQLDELCASAENKANFGFVSHYQQGATEPTGNTQFQFSAGGLRFHSSSYDWLVVAGHNKAKYKGSGTVDGEGDFGFMLTAVDNGSSGDTFRIKIWDRDNGDAIVYDNKNGSGDDGYDGTVIGGGSIVVHD